MNLLLQSLSLCNLVHAQVIKYVASTKAGQVSLAFIHRILAKIKRLSCGLTEAEMVQIANLLPESDVELYLVSIFTLHRHIYVCISETI